MFFGTLSIPGTSEILFLMLIASTAASASFAVFLVGLYWFRHEQKLVQKRILEAIAQASKTSDQVFVTDEDAMSSELVAQFKVRRGKQVVSVLEANGKRFIHVEGDLSVSERARMVRYLKSEGFMS